MAFYQALRNGQSIENHRGWLMAVLRNQIGKFERAQSRHPEKLEPHDVMETFAPNSASPAELAAEDVELCEYLEVLSKREEEVLLLRLTGYALSSVANRSMS
jgi:DNA-directed RNA polymerase specialized sigma24 family protein